MLQPINRRDVYEPSVNAVIDGQELEVDSADLDRALPDPYTRAELTSASGVLSVLDGPDVTETVATPWDPGRTWPPAPEAPASISVDSGDGPVPALAVGRVISATGDAAGRAVEVEVADLYQSLDKTISWDALARVMPLAEEGVGDRYVGLHSVAITDRILRYCGWYATPPPLSYLLLSVPAMGTMWPETGACDTCVRASTGGFPSWDATPWGVGVSDVDAEYTLAGASYTLKQRNNIELTAMTATTAASCYMTVSDSAGVGMFRLLWTASTGYIQARTGGSYSTIASVSRSEGLLYATVSYVSDTSVTATIRSGSRESTQTATVDTIVTTGSPDEAEILVPAGCWASAFQVAMPARAGALETWLPSVNMKMRQFNRNNLIVLKAVESVNCADLLADQCVAEAATCWIDETGVFQWWDLARLEAESSVATLNSDDDIEETGFSWSHSLSQVKSRVLVKWAQPVETRRWRTTVDLWQGNGESLQPGEEPVEQWVNVPDDEVWISVDMSPKRVGTGSMDDFNGGIFSWYGAVISRSGDEPDIWAQQNGSLLMTIERVTDNAYKLTTEWHGDLVAIQRTAGDEASSALWKRRRNFDLPILRGRAKYQLLDQETHSPQTGPSTAPEYVIDAGFWIQLPEQADYTANYAGARMTIPQPVLSAVHLIPVPGLQIGDVVTVEDTHVTRLTIRGIVVEDSRSIRSDMAVTHRVAIRPTYVTRNKVTWREWAHEARPKTWTRWATQQASTWAEWGKNPLAKED